MSTCTICCEIVVKNVDTSFQQVIGGTCPDRILRVSENFVVLPSIGQIVEGYLLIVTKKHCLSMGELSEKHIVELECLMREVSVVLGKVYQSETIFFEHGSVSCIGEGGSCVDHAHLHAVPVSVDLLPKIPSFYEVRKIDSFYCLREQVEKGIPYCFYESANNEKYMFDATVVPSQFFRQLVASEIGESDIWNWRMFPETPKLLATVEKLKDWEVLRS